MIKNATIKLIVFLALLAFSAVAVTACGGDKEDKAKTSNKDKGDKDKGDKAKGDKADVDVCAKAKKCADGLIAADPASAKGIEQAWKFIETQTGDAKIEQCKQILQGAGFNPKAPAECK